MIRRFVKVLSRGLLFKGSEGMAWASGFIMIILVLSVFVDVIGHNTPFRVPWSAGTYELAELLMSLISCLGLAYCWYKGGHVRIELVLDRLGPKGKAFLDMMASILTLAFISAIGWRILVLAVNAIQRSEETDIIKLPVGLFMFVFGIVMLHFVLVLAGFFLQHLFVFLGVRTESDEDSGGGAV